MKFVKEVNAWKWLRHDNILPLFGVLDSLPFSMVSEFMENGNIVNFVKVHPNHNRLQLVSERTVSNSSFIPTVLAACGRRLRSEILA